MCYPICPFLLFILVLLPFMFLRSHGFRDILITSSSSNSRHRDANVLVFLGFFLDRIIGSNNVVALSKIEAEYMTLSEATKEGLWLREFCSELGFGSQYFFSDYIAIHKVQYVYLKNVVHHDRIKDVANRIHFIKDIVDFGSVKIHKIHTNLNPADMLTKCLPSNAFEKCLVTLKVIV